MISASHNPMPDNGIKLFGRGGRKLPDELEDEIEAAVAAALGERRPTGAGVGRVRDLAGARRATTSTTCSPPSPHPLDRAHGRRRLRARRGLARSRPRSTAGPARRSSRSAAEPDGWNINDGVGSTHLEPLTDGRPRARRRPGHRPRRRRRPLPRGRRRRRRSSTATRSSPSARSALHERGRLTDDTVVATVMSNLGFHQAMRDAGIASCTTAVGDRYVLEALRARRAVASAASRAATSSSSTTRPPATACSPACALLARMAATGALARRARRGRAAGCRRC